MDFGIHIGTRGCLASRANIMTLARRAEVLGYAYLGIADHLVVPVQSAVRYPYTADGIWPGQPTGECFDALATLAFLAACTERVKLLTSVAVVPYRPAVLAAKLSLTADVLSGGRVIAGIGSGWMREEFEALVRRPMPSAAWSPMSMCARGRRYGPRRARPSTGVTQNLPTWCSCPGRPRSPTRQSGLAGKDPDEKRQLFTGSPADWLEDAATLSEAGARHVILYAQRPTIDETLDLLPRFSEAVVAQSS